MIRLADYLAQTLAARGVRHLFLVTGGGAMHLNDAIGREPCLLFAKRLGISIVTAWSHDFIFEKKRKQMWQR